MKLNINLPELEYKQLKKDSDFASLYFSGVSTEELVKNYGTPLYVYSADYIKNQISSLQKALGNQRHLICYSVKANSNLSLLKLIKDLGCGADIVSGGELFRCEKVGMNTNRIIFAGVGKTSEEIQAALKANIMFFSVESSSELEMINTIALGLGVRAKVSLRVNPNVNANTHHYISTGKEEDKFGIALCEIENLIEKSKLLKGIELCALGFHIGSQILDSSCFSQAAKIVVKLMSKFKSLGIDWKYIDVGGGLGIRYKDENPPSPEEYIKELLTALDLKKEGLDELCLLLEPGRFIVGNSGILITRIVNTKITPKKNFFICDAGMNDLMRPAMYEAFHQILPSKKNLGNDALLNLASEKKFDIVGPVCETGDFFAKDRIFALNDFSYTPHLENEFLIIASAGAYGMSMSSNYNSRPRVAEVMIKDEKMKLIRRRETMKDLLIAEELYVES